MDAPLGKNSLLLLTGSTGYVGGRLFPLLKKQGYRIRCLARHPERLPSEIQRYAEIIPGDVCDPVSLTKALAGVDAAYYLIHSLGASSNFESQEYEGAKNFAEAARQAGIKRILYLSGLGQEGSSLSPHLRSRQKVGDILRSSGIPVLEFRAGIILGSGSLSFEMVRALVERLPIMITPRWVRTPTQPIAIEDVLQYLTLGLEYPLPVSQVFEIGGSDTVGYEDLIKEYAKQRGLKRWLIPISALSPKLSSLWLGLITPLYAPIGKKLVESIRNPTLVQNPAALHAFPIRPMGIKRAIARALAKEDQDFAQTHWSDALSSFTPKRHWGGLRLGSRLVDSRSLSVQVPPEIAFRPIQEIGGARGWYYANLLWKIRGALDRVLGGVGLRRGRRDPLHLKTGDALDFWRVENLIPHRRLLLRAEMKLPGRAWLEFEVDPQGQGSIIRQTALFDPLGVFGLLYWYGLYPIHDRIFSGMLRNIARLAEQTPAKHFKIGKNDN